jgi:GTP-binding protein HflX
MARNARAHIPPQAEEERGLVVAVDERDRGRPLDPELAEFETLIDAAGARVVGRVVQRLERADPATLVGSGKAREIALVAKDLAATKLFVFNDLRPRQRSKLENVVPLPVVDRSMVILDIFAQRARSREGKLQVELAQLRHRQANLIGTSTALSRLGGGVGTRGPGETKLEVDRRRIGQRISVLRDALDQVRRARAVRRAPGSGTPLVALVGYTNVGKSSLLNRLAGASGSGAFVADQPFATLDPTLRRVYLATDRFARLADTVGFITELPKELISAFRATLEELEDADVLIHVVDASNPEWPRQSASVDAILRELQVDRTPTILAFNKSDIARGSVRPAGAVNVSAKTGAGLQALRAEILRQLDCARDAAR